MEMGSEEKCLEVLNKLFAIRPIHISELQKFLPLEKDQALRQLELEHPEVGVVPNIVDGLGISFLSLLATVTDLLIDRRLMFVIDMKGYIIRTGRWLYRHVALRSNH